MRLRSILSVPSVLAVALSACIADLPAATQCPPAVKHTASDCTQKIGQGASAGCAIDLDTVQCLAGTRTSCVCGANECPLDRGACYPQPECPGFVTDKVGAGVSCLRLPSEAISGNTDSCACGCAACASVCDGADPVIAARLASGTNPPSLRVDNLNTLLPSSGRIGLYLRVRGVAGQAPGAAIIPAGSAQPFGSPITLASATDFTEVLVYDANQSPRWTRAEDRPTSLALFPQTGPTIFEVDCIIPFIVNQ